MATKRQEIRSNLEAYLAKAHGNTQKVLQRRGAWIRLINEVDEAFVLAEESLLPTEGTVVGAIVIASHGSWLAATNLGLSMHSADSLQPARASIESAFYGYHIQADPSSFDRWKKRPTMAEIRAKPAEVAELKKQRRDVGAEFSVTAIARTFPRQFARRSERARDLYEELIDFGAHFNFPALDRSFRPTGKGADYYSAEVRILLAQEPEQVFALRNSGRGWKAEPLRRSA